MTKTYDLKVVINNLHSISYIPRGTLVARECLHMPQCSTILPTKLITVNYFFKKQDIHKK